MSNHGAELMTRTFPSNFFFSGFKALGTRKRSKSAADWNHSFTRKSQGGLFRQSLPIASGSISCFTMDISLAIISHGSSCLLSFLVLDSGNKQIQRCTVLVLFLTHGLTTPTKVTAHKALGEKLRDLREGPSSRPAQAVEEKDLVAKVISLGTLSKPLRA